MAAALPLSLVLSWLLGGAPARAEPEPEPEPETETETEPETETETETETEPETETETETEAEAEVIQLAPPELPASALSDLAEVHEDTRGLAPGLMDALMESAGSDLALPGVRLPIRSALLLRPATTLLLALPEARLHAGLGLGVSVGHRWFPLSQRSVRWGGENRIDLQGMAGRVRGWRVALTAEAGPWVGPVGLRLGLRADASRWRVGDDALVPSLLLGPQATLGVSVGVLHPWVAFAPQWQAAGSREAVSKAFTEWRGEAGLAVEGPVLWHRVSVSARQTHVGTVLGVSYGAAFRPRFERPTADVPEEAASDGEGDR